MNRLFTLFFIFVCFFGFGSQTQAATKTVYESDFSSNPAWGTDQVENFYWNEIEQNMHLHASITPSGAPSRYFVTQTDLNPTKSFSLTYDFKIENHFKYSIFTFGLFSPDLLSEQNRRTTPFKTPESTFNFSHNEGDTRFNFHLYGYGLHVFTDELAIDQGFGGSGPAWQPTPDTWYRVTLSYDAPTNKVFYRVLNIATDTVLLETPDGRSITGDFSENMQYLGFSLYPQGEFGTTAFDPSRLPGAGTFAVDNVLLIQETEEEPEPPLSDLLLQYEPILQFHEEEDYYPINVEAFVEGSGLWNSDGTDTLLVPRGDGNELNLDYLATTTDTTNWYIAFSSDEAGEYDLDAAKTRYDELVSSGKAAPTYYAYEGEDSYIDEFGTKHEFIVLQYWYFYAMNNWQEQGGFNNHEGDWESVFVFLDKETEEPKYVAFSAHHNDGDPFLNPKQYESVRREWVDTERTGNQVTSYVAAGSHANYSFEADHNVPSFNPFKENFDRTSTNGVNYDITSWMKKQTLKTTGWPGLYGGLYGTKIGIGSSGTQGPLFTSVSGFLRFEEPIAWAGIDKIAETKLSAPQRIFNLTEQGVRFIFDTALNVGTEISSSLHEEFISFGDNLSEYNLLPKFWDFNTNLPEGSFAVEVTLHYSDEEIANLNLDENSLRAFYYDATEHIWMVLPSTVDKENNEVQFKTDHFSIYTIGEVPKELLLENVPHKVNWGDGSSPQDGNRIANVSFQNKTNQILTGPLAIVVETQEALHENIDGVSNEFGPYQEIQPEEYGRCLFIGSESDLPESMDKEEVKKLLEHKQINCTELVGTYPELEKLLIYGLQSSDFSDSIKIELALGSINNVPELFITVLK